MVKRTGASHGFDTRTTRSQGTLRPGPDRGDLPIAGGLGRPGGDAGTANPSSRFVETASQEGTAGITHGTSRDIAVHFVNQLLVVESFLKKRNSSPATFCCPARVGCVPSRG